MSRTFEEKKRDFSNDISAIDTSPFSFFRKGQNMFRNPFFASSASEIFDLAVRGLIHPG
jgi:hypothetical protein